ncbi:unnamed protein product [Heligmosomoides polygyrus]|uniref:BrnT family toxin n=1 Tax=Heligmosomoides polygyrus TaxID=6339 RepID=A0A3P7YGT6_HELPZ|nr:unnamed protein product [Heligmosomoides polygyrus]
MMAPSVSLDTTTIHFDQPIWDNPELREELLDSEEDFALDATPPSLREDTVAVDEIIRAFGGIFTIRTRLYFDAERRDATYCGHTDRATRSINLATIHAVASLGVEV